MTMGTSLVSGDSAVELRRRRELANFLRTRRQELSPAGVGIPAPARRRRVEGLRREEVAELAGISASWYTWLEQGRPIRVSPETVERLSTALQLDRDEKDQLFLLSELPPPRVVDRIEAVPAGVSALLRAFDPWPALVICSRWDLLDWNAGAERLFGDFGLTPAGERNLLWLMFTRPAFCGLFAEPDKMKRCAMGYFRAEFGKRIADRNWTSLVESLERISPEFQAIWREHYVLRSPDWQKEMRHPELGRLAFDTVTLAVPPEHQTRVLFYHPADEETRRKWSAAS